MPALYNCPFVLHCSTNSAYQSAPNFRVSGSLRKSCSITPSARTFINLFVPDKILPEPSHPDGEQVAGEGFSPSDISGQIGPFEAAPRNSVFEADVGTFTQTDAGGSVVARRALHEPGCLYRLDADLPEVPADNRVVGSDLLRFPILEWSSAASFDAAAGALARLKVAAEPRAADRFVDDRFADNEHAYPSN
jgi:hypothetical protein